MKKFCFKKFAIENKKDVNKVNQSIHGNKGFVLAETLIVTVFLMILFTMIYSNFYPLIGEYEKRENYDDVDGKYVAYWMRKLIESDSYTLKKNSGEYYNMKYNKYVRFECSDISETSQMRSLCTNLVNEYEIDGCRGVGNNCEIYITDYKIGGSSDSFKNVVSNNSIKKYQENCYDSSGNYKGNDICKKEFDARCKADLVKGSETDEKCKDEADEKVFSSSFQDYIKTLPDYKNTSSSFASLRVIVVVKHTKDYNNYLSYSTAEVSKSRGD